MRQIDDWRSGQALTIRRDLRTLGMVFDVERDPARSDTSIDLYHSAQVIAASGGGKRRPVPVIDPDAGTVGARRLVS